MKNRNLALISSLALAAGGYGLYRWTYRMPLKDYTRYALYMAVLDDEICRSELDGIQMDGGTVVFPEKSRSLQDRYHLFLQMNRKKNRRKIQQEILELKQRLREMRQDQLTADEAEIAGIPQNL